MIKHQLFKNLRFYIFKILAVFLFLFSATLGGQETEDFSSRPLSIAEAIDLSLQKNPGTAAAWWRAKRAAATVGITRSDLYPSLTANILYAQGKDFEFINGPNKTYREASASFILNYLLFDFNNTQLSIQSAKAALIATGWENEYQIQQTICQTLLAAYYFLEALDQKQSLEISVEEAQLMVETAEDKFQAGLSSENDLFASKARLAEQRALLSHETAHLEIARGALAKALSISYSPCLTMCPLPDPDKNELPFSSFCFNTLLNLAERHRKDFQSQWARLSEAQILEKKASRSGYPTLTLRADTGMQTYFDKRKGQKGDYNVVVNFNAPIFTGFKNTYERHYALANTGIEWQRTIELQLESALEILTFSEELKAAEISYQCMIEALYYSEKAYRGELDKYKIGATSIYDLVDSQSMLTRARLKKNEAKSRLYRSMAELAFSIGLSPSLPQRDVSL